MAKIDYINSLPKKIVGCAVIFLNKDNELLIVKPNYRDGWLVPGGSVEALESPFLGAIREVKEEIGLDIKELKFLSVHHRKGVAEEGTHYDSLQFTFFGGVLSDEQISNIILQEKELDEFKFCKIEEALALLGRALSQRIRDCIEVMAGGTSVYLDQK